MKLMFGLPLFYLLLFCATRALGVTIQSVPEFNNDGVIQTELEKTVSLVCQLDSGSEPQADKELVWLRNGTLLSLKEGNKEGRSSVCITPILHEDNGANFTCHLSKNVTFTATITLDVTYPPEISGSEEVTVEEESDLLLQCDIDANPPVANSSWTFNGKEIDLAEGGFMVTNDGVKIQILANKVEKSLHEGTYACSAYSNKYGQHTKTFHVTLTEKTMEFPLIPIIAGLVVVFLTLLLAFASRWKKIAKCCKKIRK